MVDWYRPFKQTSDFEKTAQVPQYFLYFVLIEVNASLKSEAPAFPSSSSALPHPSYKGLHEFFLTTLTQRDFLSTSITKALVWAPALSLDY